MNRKVRDLGRRLDRLNYCDVRERSTLKADGWVGPHQAGIDGVITKRIPAVVALGVEHDGRDASASGIGECRDFSRGDRELAVTTPFKGSGSTAMVVTLLADG
jgi:hypothetical protein